MPQPTRDQVFISYSHKDRDWLDKLQIVLKPLIRKGTISIWDDTQIQVGDQWRNQIAETLVLLCKEQNQKHEPKNG